MTTPFTMLLLDSGLERLLAYQAIRDAHPHGKILYLSDSGFAAWGALSIEDLEKRINALIERTKEEYGYSEVIVLNLTTSTKAIEGLSARWPTLYIGTEPRGVPDSSDKALTTFLTTGVAEEAEAFAKEKYNLEAPFYSLEA